MRAHYLQHVPFEGLGSIEPWLQKAGYPITNTRLFFPDALPPIAEIEGIDFLIVMGGPMSVNDEVKYPWLAHEKTFIRTMIETGKPVLGICLGAQLIASAMGGDVFPNSVKEIGWFPIQKVASDSTDVFQFPETIEVFHWHGETFTLPQGAVRLAQSACCENQAFQIGRNVLGLQFHLETTPLSAQAIVQNCREELVPDLHIQSESAILSAPPTRYLSINRLMDNVLDYLLSPDQSRRGRDSSCGA